MKKTYVVGVDYDGTLFDTKAPSPDGIGLEEGHTYAIQTIFGREGLDFYRSQGGLLNRAPSEVISSIVENPRFRNIACQQFPQLDRQIDLAEFASNLTELFIHFKLQVFLNEISQEWPLPFPGVRNFLSAINELRKEGIPLDWGILSSGHQSFIKKTLKTHQIPFPDAMVTDDDIRPLANPEDPKEKVKPAPFPFRFFLERWLAGSKVKDERLTTDPSYMIYIGDDLKKDGGLATNVGIPFGWFRNGSPLPATFYQDFPEGSFSFSNWNSVAKFLKESKELLRLGTLPVGQILKQFR